MKRLSWSDPETITYIATQLHSGKIVLAEGDTVLGLLSDVSVQGVAQLNSIKKRFEKPYLVLAGTVQKVFAFIEIEPSRFFQIEKFINNCWPGPVTLIFKAKKGGFEPAQSPQGTIAIRVPQHAGLLQLLSHFQALFSTSANISGQPVPHTLEDVDSSIIDAVACVVMNDFQEQNSSMVPSTIIDCTGEKPVVVRQGAFDARQLLEFM
jgi:L-threonylcarbamoyladenylate synthase